MEAAVARIDESSQRRIRLLVKAQFVLIPLCLLAAAILAWQIPRLLETLDQARQQLAEVRRNVSELEVKMVAEGEKLNAMRGTFETTREALQLYQQATRDILKKEYASAFKNLQAAAVITPSDAHVLEMIGYVSFLASNIDNAKFYLGEAIKKDPAYARAYFSLTLVQCEESKADAKSNSLAAGSLKQAIALDSDYLKIAQTDSEFKAKCKNVIKKIGG